MFEFYTFEITTTGRWVKRNQNLKGWWYSLCEFAEIIPDTLLIFFINVEYAVFSKIFILYKLLYASRGIQHIFISAIPCQMCLWWKYLLMTFPIFALLRRFILYPLHSFWLMLSNIWPVPGPKMKSGSVMSVNCSLYEGHPKLKCSELS